MHLWHRIDHFIHFENKSIHPQHCLHSGWMVLYTGHKLFLSIPEIGMSMTLVLINHQLGSLPTQMNTEMLSEENDYVLFQFKSTI